jgi:ABC-type transport system substrate-binding protein
LVYQGDEAGAKEDAEYLSQVFSANKIPVNLIPLNGQAGRALAESGDYDLWLGARTPDLPSPELWLGQFLESRAVGRGNPAFFRNREVDEAIAGFQGSLPRDQRERKIGEVELLAAKETPYAFLYQKFRRFLVDRRLAKQKTHPMWPTTWPLLETNLNPFKDARVKKPAPLKPTAPVVNQTLAEPKN